MKYYLTIENDEGQVIYETDAPTFEILEERVGQLERNKEKSL